MNRITAFLLWDNKTNPVAASVLEIYEKKMKLSSLSMVQSKSKSILTVSKKIKFKIIKSNIA